uniref:Integrase catalytic domain-containing protein n=1 Tax=Plectus sambesii TaxID=2011161 RepID=A0A914WCW5_9BILA
MPAMSWLDVEFVRDLFFKEKYTIDGAVAYLQFHYPEQNGISARNLRRFLKENGISIQQRLSTAELEDNVRVVTDEFAGVLGRKKMQAALRLRGIKAGQDRIRLAQAKVAPAYQERRRQGTERRLNPQSYRALHFGYNLHVDQNETLVQYGIVFVIAVDGKSSFIVHAAIMPRKNNIAIYELMYVPAVSKYGLWDQVIADGGREFYLVHHIQEYLTTLRIKDDGELSDRPPYRQVTSMQNNRVERLWQEVNEMVGYPLKAAYIALGNAGIIDLANDVHKFTCSYIGCILAKFLMQRCMDIWNHHNIPKKGIPADFVDDRRNYAIPDDALPSTDAAVRMYVEVGQLTEETSFGVDPLAGQPEKQLERNNAFWLGMDVMLGGVQSISESVLHEYYGPLQQAFNRFIEMSMEMLTN